MDTELCGNMNQYNLVVDRVSGIGDGGDGSISGDGNNVRSGCVKRAETGFEVVVLMRACE